jgi:hypothetical protein
MTQTDAAPGEVVSTFTETTGTETLTKTVFARIGPDAVLWQQAEAVLSARVTQSELAKGAGLLPRRWRKFLARSRHS